MFGPTYSTDPSYATADAFLHTRGKPVPRKKVANNTYLERHDMPGFVNVPAISLVLHRTRVVTYSEDGLIVLDTGGWLTVTTKDRINSGLPHGWRIASDRGTWTLYQGFGLNVRTVARYTDGISLRHGHQGWDVIEATCLPDEQRVKDDRHNATTKKLVGHYVKNVPTDGDFEDTCTLCQGTWTTNMVNNREVLTSYGDDMGDTQHLLEHMLDGIYPSSLITAALTAAGYLGDVGHGNATLKRTLRSYLLARLLVGATAGQHGRRPVAV